MSESKSERAHNECQLTEQSKKRKSEEAGIQSVSGLRPMKRSKHHQSDTTTSATNVPPPHSINSIAKPVSPTSPTLTNLPPEITNLIFVQLLPPADHEVAWKADGHSGEPKAGAGLGKLAQTCRVFRDSISAWSTILADQGYVYNKSLGLFNPDSTLFSLVIDNEFVEHGSRAWGHEAYAAWHIGWFCDTETYITPSIRQPPLWTSPPKAIANDYNLVRHLSLRLTNEAPPLLLPPMVQRNLYYPGLHRISDMLRYLRVFEKLESLHVTIEWESWLGRYIGTLEQIKTAYEAQPNAETRVHMQLQLPLNYNWSVCVPLYSRPKITMETTFLLEKVVFGGRKAAVQRVDGSAE